jgi:hypothetical protein
MSMYTEFSKLKEGQKITIIGLGEFGFPAKSLTTFHSVREKPHYYNCAANMYGVEIIHKPKGKRTHYKKSIDYNSGVLVYDGHVNIDIDSLINNIKEDKNFVIKESKYPCFDKRYLQDIKAAINKSPIIELNSDK